MFRIKWWCTNFIVNRQLFHCFVLDNSILSTCPSKQTRNSVECCQSTPQKEPNDCVSGAGTLEPSWRSKRWPDAAIMWYLLTFLLFWGKGENVTIYWKMIDIWRWNLQFAEGSSSTSVFLCFDYKMETDQEWSIAQFQFFKLVEACEEHQRIVRSGILWKLYSVWKPCWNRM